MGAVGYRLRAFLRARRGGVAGLAVIVALVGGLALTLTAGALRTLSAPDRYSRSRGDAFDLSIQQDDGRPRTDEIEALPAIEHAVGVTFVFGFVGRDDGSEPFDSLVFAGSQDAFGTQLVEGRVPDPAHAGEFVATRSLVEAAHASVGDSFVLHTLTPAQAAASGFDAASDPQGPTLDATLVGVIDGPADLDDGYAVIAFPRSLIDGGDVAVSGSQIVASLAPGATADDARQQIDGLPSGQSLLVEPAMWVSDEVRAAVNAQGQGLAILALVVAVGAVVVLGQLLSRQLRLGDDERTTLEALGLDRSLLLAEPVCRAAVATVIGAVGAGAVAYAASDVFPLGFVRRVEPHLGRRLDPLVHVAGPFVLIVVVLAIVAVTTAASARPTPATTAPSLVDRAASAVPFVTAATALRFGFGRAGERARRSGAPLVGLVLMSCVAFGAIAFGANLGRLIEHPALYGDNYDLALGQGEDQIADETLATLKGSPDVAGVILYGVTRATVGARSLDIVGMQPVYGGLAPVTEVGRLPQGADEIALGRVIAGDLDVGVGDDLELVSAAGTFTVRVTGIARVPLIGGSDRIGLAGLVNEAGFARLDPSAGYSAAAVTLKRDVPPGAADRLSELLGGAVGSTSAPPAIVNLDRVRDIPFVVAAAVGALALLSLGHLLIMSMRRRQRDFAVLRALGASRAWLTAVVHWQATFVAAAVVVVAVPVGSALGNILYRQFVDRVGASTEARLPVLTLAAAVLALVVLANLAAAVAARRARRVAPSRLLAGG